MSNERFVRWQNNTLTQFGAVNNLLIGLAVAALGFVVSQDGLPYQGLSFWVPAIGFTASATCGVWCAVNRLHDFRETAQIAKGGRPSEELEAAREEVAALGKASWRLLNAQIVFFAVGAFWVVLAVASSRN